MLTRKRSSRPSINKHPMQKGPSRRVLCGNSHESSFPAETNPGFLSHPRGSPDVENNSWSDGGIDDSERLSGSGPPVSKLLRRSSSDSHLADALTSAAEWQQGSVAPADSVVPDSGGLLAKNDSLSAEDSTEHLAGNDPALVESSPRPQQEEEDDCVQLLPDSAGGDCQLGRSNLTGSSDGGISDFRGEWPGPRSCDGSYTLQLEDTGSVSQSGGPVAGDRSLASVDMTPDGGVSAGVEHSLDCQEQGGADLQLRCPDTFPREPAGVVTPSDLQPSAEENEAETECTPGHQDSPLESCHQWGSGVKQSTPSESEASFVDCDTPLTSMVARSRLRRKAIATATATDDSRLCSCGDSDIDRSYVSTDRANHQVLSECLNPLIPSASNSTFGSAEGRNSRYKILALNVGGYLYSALSTTLSMYPGSPLYSLTTDSPQFPILPGGSFYIDRDGSHFSFILDYLRRGTVALEPVMLKPSPLKYEVAAWLCAEAKFYQLEELNDNLTVVIFTSLLQLDNTAEHCLRNILRIQLLDLGDEKECFAFVADSNTVPTQLSSVPHDYQIQTSSQRLSGSHVNLKKISFAQFSWANLSIRRHVRPLGDTYSAAEETEQLFTRRIEEFAHSDLQGRDVTYAYYYSCFANMHFKDEFSADYCNLSGVLFLNCYFEGGADFTGSILRGTRFVECYGLVEHGVTFSPMQAREAVFDPELRSALSSN